jgi:hypothetical protein
MAGRSAEQGKGFSVEASPNHAEAKSWSVHFTDKTSHFTKIIILRGALKKRRTVWQEKKCALEHLKQLLPKQLRDLLRVGFGG